MPIYAYRCEECGHADEVLQKISDPQLTDCPACSKSSFKKQLTAAGFQLKGTGWYVTDFRGGSAPATGVASTPKSDAPAAAPAAESSSAAPAAAAPAAPAAATKPAA
jgi:putative FmdB family regulatory protein